MTRTLFDGTDRNNPGKLERYQRLITQLFEAAEHLDFRDRLEEPGYIHLDEPMCTAMPAGAPENRSPWRKGKTCTVNGYIPQDIRIHPFLDVAERRRRHVYKTASAGAFADREFSVSIGLRAFDDAAQIQIRNPGAGREMIERDNGGKIQPALFNRFYLLDGGSYGIVA